MNFAKIHSEIRPFIAVWAFLAIQCCSPSAVKPPSPALDAERVAALVAAFAMQARVAETLFFTGTLTFNDPNGENAVQILMIADAPPPAGIDQREGAGACPHGRMKIEITHPWGKPLTHILAEGQHLHILDFSEKRIYKGSLKSKGLSRRIPVPLDPSILWSLARAFPAVLKHRENLSVSGNQFTLTDALGDKVQRFELYRSEPLPRRVNFFKQNATIVFSDFEDEGGILYARQVRFHGPDHEVGLKIEIDQMTFNTPLPNAVFSMEAPPDFRAVHLKDDDPEH